MSMPLTTPTTSTIQSVAETVIPQLRPQAGGQSRMMGQMAYADSAIMQQRRAWT